MKTVYMAHALRMVAGATLVSLVSAMLPASAALKTETVAPLFTASASLGGAVSSFSLADALKRGPVVLYFYPAAFTPGCTVEAHDFADATDEFRQLGATVIGVSHDDIDTLKRFSTTECRSKFAVAADTDGKIMRAYDSVMTLAPEHASRTSYLIGTDGKVVYVYESMSPGKHVANLLQALRDYNAKQHH